MELKFAKHVVVVDLGEYMAEMSGQALHVWVNPAVRLRQEYILKLQQGSEGDEAAQTRVYEITAELLSQGPEESRWTADEIRKLLEESAVTDPMFWNWLVNKIVVSVETHRGSIKKN